MSEEIVAEDADIEEIDDRLLPVVRRDPGMTLFQTDDPVEVLEKATRTATALAEVIERQQLFKTIGPKRHLLVEAWTMLGSMLGVFPETEWTRRTTDSNGADAWEARVVVRTRDGSVIGAREAMCSKSESRWKNADDYAIRSMAQTRATSAALAAPLRFIPVLAGFAGTPEAEMPESRRAAEERREPVPEAKVPRSWVEILERMGAVIEDADIWLGQARELGEKLPDPTLFQRLCGVVVDTDTWSNREFPPRSRVEIQEAFGKRMDGLILPGPTWALDAKEAEGGRPSKESVEGTAADQTDAPIVDEQGDEVKF